MPTSKHQLPCRRNTKGNTLWMDSKQWTPTLNLLSLKSLSRSLSFSARASLSKARAAIMRPLPILRAPPRRRVSFSLFSRGLIGRRAWGASAALPWHPPPKLRRCGLSMTSRSSSFNRSRGSEYNAANKLVLVSKPRWQIFQFPHNYHFCLIYIILSLKTILHSWNICSSIIQSCQIFRGCEHYNHRKLV